MAAPSQGTQTSPHTGPRDQMVFGFILVAVGIAAFLAKMFETQAVVGGLVVLALGLVLLGAFAYTRGYGYLVPGGIMTGLGIGIAIQDSMTLSSDAEGGVVTLAMGLGFASIWVIARLVHHPVTSWWPLVPGGCLAAVGTALLIGGDAVKLLDYWGVVLIVFGIVVLWRAFSATRTG